MPVRISKDETLSQRVAYGKGPLLLSLPFVLAGGFFAFVGFADIELKGANAPIWVIGAVGASFLLAGLVLLANSVRGVRAAARRRALAHAPPWERDFPWDKAGTRDRPGRRVAHALFGTALLTIFLAPFNWWAFLSGAAPWPVKAGVALFDAILLLLAGNVVYLLARLVKFGRSRLGFPRFPFSPGERLDVVFSPNRFAELRCTLRFVEERYETSGHGKNRSTSLVCYEHYRDEKTIEAGALLAEIPISFDLPADPELANRLGETPVRYWELVVEAEEPGVDFATSFVLPVYAPVAAAVSV